MKRTDDIWFNNPKIIFDKDRLSEFFPVKEMSLSEKLNAILRLSIYLSVILICYKKNINYIYILLVIIFVTYYIYNTKNDQKEGYCNKTIEKIPLPTSDNPMMNINLITDDRNKPAAPLSYNKPLLQDYINDKFNVDLYRDVSDVYGKRHSQRQFYTMPSTSIPNSQTSYAKWLYGTGPTCKEDGVKCAPYWNPLNNN